MKTITFYSYKGGVGRSLALANIARRLSEIGKKVCIMDFDLDAPGLQFKFPDYQPDRPVQQGLVDYVYGFAVNGIEGASLADYSVTLKPLNTHYNNITLIPAGDTDAHDYWKKLSMIPWSRLFYSEDSEGIDFFLDLKARIEEEFAPDVLLIDSRTGITDIAAITLKIFADEVVVLAANNKENLFGCKRILKNLYDPSQALFGTAPKVNFVLTRLPFSEKPEENEKKLAVQERIRNEIATELRLSSFDLMVIHSDGSLEIEERNLMGYEYEIGISIANDYLKLFDVLAADVLNSDEVLRFNDIRLAEKEYAKGQVEKENAIRIKHFTNAINMDGKNSDYYVARGLAELQMEYWDDAIADFKSAIPLVEDPSKYLYLIGHSFYRKGDYRTALNYLDQSKWLAALVLKIKIYDKMGNREEALNFANYVLAIIPEHHETLNLRANLFRYNGSLEEAYRDIFRALELSPKNAVYFATLAEIYASESKLDEFYLNLSLALSFGLKIGNIADEKELFKRFIDEEKFTALLVVYNLDVEELKQYFKE